MGEYIQYLALDSGIHHLIWQDNSADAVQAYSQIFSQIIHNSIQQFAPTPSTPIQIRFLLDFRHTPLPPFTDIVSTTIDSRRRLLSARERIIYRLAYLSDSEDLYTLIDKVGSLTTTNYKREYFKITEEEQAIAWLLADE